MKKAQVLQGLNLISPYSTVIIEVNEDDSVKKILDLVKNYHPLFIEKYYFTQGYLYIETKIPFLWREANDYLQQLGCSQISFEKCKELLVDELIKQRVASMSTIPILNTAYDLGYEITPTLLDQAIIQTNKSGYPKTYNRHHTLGCGKGSQIIYSISSSKDSKNAKEIQKDKWSTNLMISRLGLPIPKWQTIDNKSQLEEIWSDFAKPVVIKPTGLTGGNGVVVGLNTLDEAKKAFEFAQKSVNEKPREEWQKKIMIQEQVPGEDYRLLVIDGKLEIATKRIPAFIIGDGKNSIKKLINETNKDPKRDTSSPVHTLKPIVIDESLMDHLKQQNLSLDYIPKLNEKIPVRKVASMSKGGITEDFTDEVSDEIKYVVESIASSIHAFTLGVDVLCKDISKPLTKENGAILEVNTMPEAYLNFFPVLGEEREYVVETFVKKLLKENQTKKIVAIGNTLPDILTLLSEKSLWGSYFSKKDVIGEYKDGYMRINGLEINDGLEKWNALEALKVNASLDGIIVHHRDWDAVKSDGLGFNNIDLLIISKDEAEKDEMKIVKKYKTKRFINKIKIV